MLTDGLSNPHPPSVTPVCLFRVTNDLLLVMNWELIAMVLKRRREQDQKQQPRRLVLSWNVRMTYIVCCILPQDNRATFKPITARGLHFLKTPKMYAFCFSWNKLTYLFRNIAKLDISYFRSRNVSPLFRCNSSVSNVTSSQMSEKENTTDPILQIYRITELLGFLNFQENTTNLIVNNFICFVLFLYFMTQHKELLAKRYQLNKVGTFYPNKRIKTLIQSWPENISYIRSSS